MKIYVNTEHKSLGVSAIYGLCRKTSFILVRGKIVQVATK